MRRRRKKPGREEEKWEITPRWKEILGLRFFSSISDIISFPYRLFDTCGKDGTRENQFFKISNMKKCLWRMDDDFFSGQEPLWRKMICHEIDLHRSDFFSNSIMSTSCTFLSSKYTCSKKTMTQISFSFQIWYCRLFKKSVVCLACWKEQPKSQIFCWVGKKNVLE